MREYNNMLHKCDDRLFRTKKASTTVSKRINAEYSLADTAIKNQIKTQNKLKRKWYNSISCMIY